MKTLFAFLAAAFGLTAVCSASPVPATIAVLGDSIAWGKDNVPQPKANPWRASPMAFPEQAVTMYNAQAVRRYTFSVDNFAWPGAEARSLIGYPYTARGQGQIDEMNGTRKQYRAVVVEIDTNATIEAWQYNLPYAQRSGFAQWMMQAYAKVRSSQPQATIIFVTERDFSRGCTQLTAPYYGFVGASPFVDYYNNVTRNSQLSTANSLLVELEFSALYYVQGDYGVPADTQTACLHPNNSGAQKIAQYGLLPALEALL